MTSSIDTVLEQQYNNRAAVKDHVKYLNGWIKCSESYRSRVDAQLDVDYGLDPRQHLDIFPANKSNAAVHVFIHGGYWQALNKDSFSFMAEAFNCSGECAVILNYDLCPAVSIEKIITQIQQAMSWVVSNIHQYGGDPDCIQVTGHSAGGHLLAELLVTDWSKFGLKNQPFKQLNALSGLFDLQPLVHTTVNQALSMTEEVAYQNSPLFKTLWNPLREIRLNLFVGELESREYKNQSIELNETWSDELTVHLQEIPACHHFSILDDFLSDYYQPLTTFK